MDFTSLNRTPTPCIHWSACRVSTGASNPRSGNPWRTFMKTHSRVRALTLGLSMALATAAFAPMAMAGQMDSMSMQKTVMVGGAAMYPSKNIVENAVNSKDHTTLISAVQAAGLVDALKGAGPFTVFAPTNAAFEMLPAGTVDNLLKPENKTALQGVLKYHVVSGKWDAASLVKMIKENNGKATITTLAGGKLYASLDEKG